MNVPFHFNFILFYVSHVVFNKRNTGQTPYKLAIVVLPDQNQSLVSQLFL